MASDSGVKSFAAGFIQIHLTSILAAITIQGLADILHGLAAYLISLHSLAAAAYLLDVKNGRVLKAVFQMFKQRLSVAETSYIERN